MRLSLNQLTDEYTRAVIFRSKAKWYHLGEKNTQYFLNLEKNRYDARTCNAILLEDGNTVTSPTQILSRQKEYYHNLYSKDDSLKFNLVNTDAPKIND